MAERKLILGVDGGGSKTLARVAALQDGAIVELGEGSAGPSNVLAVGAAAAAASLDEAVDAALRAAGTQVESISHAVVALAGASLPDVRNFAADWAGERRLANDVDVVHDLEPLLAAGLPEGYGIALIAGTGSSVTGQNKNGERCQTGGWGHWIGDEGSGFDLGRRALGAVADAVDGVGPETTLVERVTETLGIDDPHDLPQALGEASDARVTIASLASLLIEAAGSGDTVAVGQLHDAVAGIAKQVVAAHERLQLDPKAPLAAAGGVVCAGDTYRKVLLAQLRELGLEPGVVTIVDEPVTGSLLMARDRLLAGQ